MIALRSIVSIEGAYLTYADARAIYSASDQDCELQEEIDSVDVNLVSDILIH